LIAIASNRPLRLNGFAAWLVERGLRGLPLDEQFDGFCHRLIDAGFPARRLNLSIRTLHPQHGARSYIWRPDGLQIQEFPRQPSGQESEAYLKSPIHHMRTTGASVLRRKLDDSVDEFPLLAELREIGSTEYVAWLVRFDPTAAQSPAEIDDAGEWSNPLKQGVFCSCATDVPGGFEDAHLQQVADVLPFLSLAVKSRSTIDIARTLLATYLGEDAGRRVVTGEIDRYALQSIPAVIWLCDLRGFSTVANRVPAGELVERVTQITR
jgi:adenylate cyclase